MPNCILELKVSIHLLSFKLYMARCGVWACIPTRCYLYIVLFSILIEIVTHFLTQIRSPGVLSIAIIFKVKEKIKLEPVEDARGCVHTFNYSLSLQSTHLIHELCSTLLLVHFI